jgi:hypothetical protein
MKKTSFLILLILSVFFSYRTAFAYTFNHLVHLTGITIATDGTQSADETIILPTGSDNGYYAFKGTYPDTSTLKCGGGLGGNSWSIMLTHGYFTMENCWANGGVATPDGDYWVVNTNGGYSYTPDFTTGDQPYFSANRTGGVWTLTGMTLPDGIVSQLTPVASSTVPYTVDFTGTYNNAVGTYRYAIATAKTGTPSIYSSTSGMISTGSALTYDLPLTLSPNQTYSYTMILCDAGGMSCTTPTSPVSFATSGLTGAISPPVWVAESCTWTDFSTWTGCLDNVFHDLFSPSSESLTQYNGLYAQFINKPPFGYIVAIQNALKGINITATSPFTLESMPILNTYIFDPIRLALGWVLWVAFAFVLYHRLKNIAI